MKVDMFMIGVFFAIGWGTGSILLIFGLSELYKKWKNK